MRIVSWNINSLLLRLPLLKKLTADLLPDFIFLQETKVQDHSFPIKEIKELGTHHMFISEVVAVNAEEDLFDKKTGKLILLTLQNK